MIKRYVAVALSVIFCFMLQTTLFKVWALAGISPNLLIIITSSVGFMRGKKEGMFAGALSGILIDLFCCDIFGLNSLIYLYVGYINGIFKKNFFPEDVRMPLILIGTSDLIYCGLTLIIRFVARGKIDILYYFMGIIMPELVYSVLVSLVMYRVILLVSSRFDKMESRSKKKYV